MSLSKSKMNVWQLTILTAVNMIGSGIILLPSKLAEVGTISLFSWIVTAGGSLALAYAFARCGMLSRKPGGMGGYAEYAFGKAGNFMANYTYGLICVRLSMFLSSPIAFCVGVVAHKHGGECA